MPSAASRGLRPVRARLALWLGKPLLAFVFAVWPLTVAAQVTVNPTTAQFDPSPDHGAVNQYGQPVVSTYDLRFYYQGAAQPFQTADLGKPAPGGDGKIRVILSAVVTPMPLPGFTYEARAAAIGPFGSGISGVSNLFTFTSQGGSTPPTTPAGLRIIR